MAICWVVQKVDPVTSGLISTFMVTKLWRTCRQTKRATATPAPWMATTFLCGIKFVIEPHIRFKGQVGEQATMFFLDPCGNAVEFKAFANPASLFAK